MRQNAAQREPPGVDKDMVENGAPASAAKVVYIVIAVAFVVLFALVAIGLHLPAGG